MSPAVTTNTAETTEANSAMELLRKELNGLKIEMTRLRSAVVATSKHDTPSQKSDSSVKKKNTDPSQGPTRDEGRPGI